MDLPLSLEERLWSRIHRDGPMPFADWMEACLYDPDEGYYTRPRAANRITGPGDDADFATSPTLHPFMAECVAREAVACWERLDRPADFAVCEFGGGEGDLARDATAWLHAHSDLRVDWLHVEAGPAHRDRQTVGTQVDALPPHFVGLVVAHEFVDALPFHVLRKDRDGWKTLHVDGGPVWLPAGPEAELAPATRDGAEVAVMHTAQAWLEDIARMRAGNVVIVDYGREGPSHDSLRTFRGHQHAGSPFEEPGTKDITADVDFRQLRTWAEAAGFHGGDAETQESFLLRHGVLEALNAIDRNTADGASAYLRLRQMLLPTGMGQAFRVLTLERRS